MRNCIAIVALLLGVVHVADAHEVRPAYLELRETGLGIYDVLWKVPALGDELRLSLAVRFPADTQNVTEPRGLFRNGAYVERWRIERTGGLAGQRIGIAGLSSTRIDTLVRLTDIDGVTQTARATPDSPSIAVAATASRWSVASSYLALGVEHILLGIDHLLFVLALVLLVQGWKQLVTTITAFTIAHSITLAAATLGFVRVPGPPVEACIALSIVFVAAEIVRGLRGRASVTARWAWLVAFTFGLLHGLGFAGALSEVGLPPHAIPVALLFFNVGVELGQLLFIAVATSILALAGRLRLSDSRWGQLATPYCIGGIAMFWVIQRIAAF
jgi:hydrogenase/urease accessory protein HupE